MSILISPARLARVVFPYCAGEAELLAVASLAVIIVSLFPPEGLSQLCS